VNRYTSYVPRRGLPPVRRAQWGVFDQLPYRTEVRKDHDELELKEYNRIDTRSTTFRVAASYQVTEEGEVKHRLDMRLTFKM